MKARLAAVLPLLTGVALADAGGGHDMNAMWQKSMARKPLAVGAAFAPDGRLWRAEIKPGQIELSSSADLGQTFVPQAQLDTGSDVIAADGENRPQLVFGPKGEIGLGWTQSLPQPFSGNARFAWSKDGGKSWSAPQTINDDKSPISHRFLALDWSSQGLSAVWLDARDKVAAKAKKRDYRGSALYSARFDTAAGRFGSNLKLADHSCECCRVALAHDPDGTPVALWRHVFEGSVRDHAVLRLDGKSPLRQASFDGWKVEACPHHGPSLNIDADGTRHLSWFNQNSGPHLLFYGRMPAGADKPENVIGFGNPEQQASHPAVIGAGPKVALAWKEFDGKQSLIRVMLSRDAGKSWSPANTLLTSSNAADYPQLLQFQQRIFLFWHLPDQGSKVLELAVEAK